MKKILFFQNLVLVITFIIVPSFIGQDTKQNKQEETEVKTDEVDNLNTSNSRGTYGTFLVGSKSIEIPIYKGSELLDEVQMIIDQDYGIPGNEQEDVILAGHNAYIGTDLGKIERDDIITIEDTEGKKYYYQVRNTEIVEEKDTEVLKNNNNTEDLIVYTCYPFNKANTTERYIVEASPIKTKQPEYEKTEL